MTPERPAKLRNAVVRAAPPSDGEKFRRLLETETSGIAIFDARWRIVETNAAFAHLLRRDSKTLVGKHLSTLLDPEDVRTTPPDWEIVGAGGVCRRDRPMLRGDGMVVPVELHCRRLEGEGYLGIFRDLTERQRLEHRVRKAEKLEAIGLLAGGIAHDFNNLLTVIGGHTELLAASVAADSELSADVRAISEAAARATGITRQLLAFARRQPLTERVFDINALVRRMAPILRTLVGADVRLELDLVPTLAWVRADEGQLEQVIVNLVLNARDAVHAGGTIELWTNIQPCPYGRPAIREVILQVRDDGCGMDEATRARIFEPFFTTKPVGRGTGLGLAVVQGIVEQSGGTIECSSTPGVGTTFRIALHQVLPPGEREPDRAETPAHGCEALLIVDDDVRLRHYLERALHRLGYPVRTAPDFAEARDIAQRSGLPHVLVTDIVLPDGYGTELARTLVGADAGVAVVLVSGYGEGELQRRGIYLDAEPWEVVQKPFELEQLVHAIGWAVRRSRASSE